MGDSGYSRASDSVLATRRALAEHVRDELVAAGLPAAIDDPADDLVGAVVEVDEGNDSGGGVFVRWAASRERESLAMEAVRDQRFDDSAIASMGPVNEAMQAAMLTLLRAAGFAVIVADEDGSYDTRPYDLRVTDGPPRP